MNIRELRTAMAILSDDMEVTVLCHDAEYVIEESQYMNWVMRREHGDQPARLGLRIPIEEREGSGSSEHPIPTVAELKAAIDILTEVHTRDVEDTGFYVMMGAMPDTLFFGGSTRYVDAWATVRQYVGKKAPERNA